MYDAPVDALSRLGWVLALVVVLLFARRAIAVERRHTSPGRTRATRVSESVLGALTVVVTLGFLAVLVLEVTATLRG